MAPLLTLVDIFTNVIVDLVSRGTGDQSLTDITPCRIYTALIQLAGVRGQTLIYVLTGASIRHQRESWETGALWPFAHWGALLLTGAVSFTGVEWDRVLGGGWRE